MVNNAEKSTSNNCAGRKAPDQKQWWSKWVACKTPKSQTCRRRKHHFQCKVSEESCFWRSHQCKIPKIFFSILSNFLTLSLLSHAIDCKFQIDLKYGVIIYSVNNSTSFLLVLIAELDLLICLSMHFMGTCHRFISTDDQPLIQPLSMHFGQTKYLHLEVWSVRKLK